jgi:hypothetical protein
VQLHGHEAFEPVGHGRRLYLEQLLRQVCGHLIRGLQGRLALAQEHRAIKLEVIVVAAIERIEVERPLAFQIDPIGDDGPGIGHHHLPVVAAENVDVGGHVLQVAGIRHQAAQIVAGSKRPLGMGRHLHQVNVHVQEPRMAPVAGLLHLLHGLFQDRDRLQGVGALGRQAGFQVP